MSEPSGAEVSVLLTSFVEANGVEIRPKGKNVQLANRTDAKCKGVAGVTMKEGILGIDALEKLGVTLKIREKRSTISGTPSAKGQEGLHSN